MQISSSSSSYSPAMQMLMQLMQSGSSTQAGQNLPASSDGASAPQALPPGPPPQSSGFATQTLSALMDLQQNQPTSTNIASNLIQQFDANGDGELSLSEIESALNGTDSASSTGDSSSTTTSDSAIAQAFAKLDTNGDGELSTSELAAAISAMQPSAPPSFAPPSAADIASTIVQQLDTNGDGELSLSEIESALNGTGSSSGASDSSSTTSDTAIAQAFSKLDTNGDGELSVTELQSAITAFQQAQAALWSGGSTATDASTSQTA